MGRQRNLASPKPDKRQWTSPTQKVWLLERMESYTEAKSRRSFVKFWPAFYRDWFEAFPPPEPTDDDPMESEAEHSDSDGDSDSDIDIDIDNNEGDPEAAQEGSAQVATESVRPPKARKKGRKKAVIDSSQELTPYQKRRGQMIKRIKKRLKTWMRWHCPKGTKRKSHATTNRSGLPTLTSPSVRRRVPKETEAFSKLYYAERIFPVVASRTTSSTSKAQRIALIAAITKEVWEQVLLNNEKAVIENVRNFIKNAKKLLEEDEDEKEKTPEQYQISIDGVDDYLQEVARYVMRETGLCSSLYVGGMLPYRGGKIFSTSVHLGEDSFGNAFNIAHKELETTFVSPFHEFLRNKFPPEARAARAIAGSQNSEDSSTGDILQDHSLITMEKNNEPTTEIFKNAAVVPSIPYATAVKSPAASQSPPGSPPAPRASRMPSPPAHDDNSNPFSPAAHPLGDASFDDVIDASALGDGDAFVANGGGFGGLDGNDFPVLPSTEPPRPQPEPPRPQPRPAATPSAGDRQPDPFAQLGRSRPWTPSNIQPTTSNTLVDSATVSATSIAAFSANSAPVPSSLTALKIRAAAEEEAKAVAAMQASIDLQHKQITPAPIVEPGSVAVAPSSALRTDTPSSIVDSTSNGEPAGMKTRASRRRTSIAAGASIETRRQQNAKKQDEMRKTRSVTKGAATKAPSTTKKKGKK